MPLHRRARLHEVRDADIYATQAADQPIPKLTMPAHGLGPDATFGLVCDELAFDGNSRQNLATFCQTWLEDGVHRLMDLAIDKNLVDRDEYPATSELERRCVHMIADLWHAPDGDATGCSTVGSSEAAMLGGLAMKRRWQARQRAAAKPTDRPNLVTGPVQICWHKFARYFDVELREVPMAAGRLGLTPETAEAAIDENTIGVVPTLGVTFTGCFEPVAAIASMLDRVNLARGLDVPIHVDAASGGFLAPFAAPDLLWDFRLPRVKSINASGHKFGLAPLGVGWVLWRDHAQLPDELVFHVNYLGGNMPDFALNFSRPGGQVIAQYYLFVRLGYEGYRAIQQIAYDVAGYLAKALEQLGPFEILFDGNKQHGIPAVCWTLRAGGNTHFSLFDLSDRIRMEGWQVAAYMLPPDLEGMPVMRALVRHGFSRDMADRLIEDLRKALNYFKQHPMEHPSGADEGSSDPHSGVAPR